MGLQRERDGGTSGLAPPSPPVSAEADFDAFVVGSSGSVLRMAELLTGDLGRAEDLVQDAYAKTYLHWDRIRTGDPWAYVRRCVLNGYTDWLRRKPWREQPSETLPERIAGGDHADRHADRQALLKALDGLTRTERAVVVMRYYQDLSEAQIGHALRIAPGTVKSTTARAMSKLRTSAHLIPNADPEPAGHEERHP